MKNVYVVTHPEATHHVDGLVGGWYDSDLTERGVAQAGRIADALAGDLGDTIPTIYTSDLLRTRRTAEIIAGRLSSPLKVDPDLRERSFGEAGGKPQAWLQDHLVPATDGEDWTRHDEGIPGTETRMAVVERIYAALQRIRDDPAEHQVVVTHGGTASYLFAAWIGMPIQAAPGAYFRVTSGGISLLRKDDHHHPYELARLNRTDHLD
ncbi:histidine phosphatase family protein [Microlunatus parietis]|uniref:histidine phosphatase family protein n=1 Tax=Microlunatus parietis TaxID=682979 RepID=UPI0015CA1E68|nr:histidine phosphatase family protein [Microlunatus parietis]